MEIREAIQTRRSIRCFDQNKKIDKSMIEQFISDAIYAPSACNKQAWKFIIIDDNNVKNNLTKNYGSPIIATAPLGILVLYRKDVSLNTHMYYDHIQSAAAAIQNLMLSAHSVGVGSCWICQLPSKKYIRKIFHIPRVYDIVAYIALGYPKEYLSFETIEHYRGDEKMLN